MNLDDRVTSLSDENAVRLLQQFSKAQQKPNAHIELNDSVSQQLQAETNIPTESALASSEGDLARAALLLIANDPDHRVGIQAMLDQPKMESYAVLETAAVVTAVLIALQTHIKFERDQNGQWIVKIEKMPTDPGLLKDLVKRLLFFRK